MFKIGHVLIYLTEPVHSNRLAGREGRDSLYQILLLQNGRKQFLHPKFDLHISFSIYLEDIFILNCCPGIFKYFSHLGLYLFTVDLITGTLSNSAALIT